ncbi:plasmid recombination enzyme [Salmonella enterica]|nr:plasmid recombination enzyme [Salmonella enterica]EBH9194344.1 plasmid recombination enzyme [Salmonella enterica subsp. enterica serovar 4,[5],12:i:-]EBH9245671.1 plasmid recombination enzyme [Salmonella enterica subsp. enterica serovar 4,[5],12:i:-]
MAAYAIMRCKKLGSMGSVAAALQHAYRERETPNADPSRTPENEHHGARSTDEAMGRLRDMLPAKHRKDAVRAVEYVMTASPEWWEKATPGQQAEFFDRSEKWLADKYGADRVIVATVHRDEATPHLSAFVVPLTKDGRLSAKEFIGDRGKMRQDQTTYAEAVKDLGLERGIEGSKAQHQRVKTFYGELNRESARPTITADELKPQKLKGETLTEKVLGVRETPQGVAERLSAKVRAAYAPAVERASTARTAARTAKQAQESARHVREQLQLAKAENERLKAPFKGLRRDQVETVIKTAVEMQRQNAREAAVRRNLERGRDRGMER